MHLLLTNDDGINAPGLEALARALGALARLTIVAPDHNWSASGHVKTMHRPLRVWETEIFEGQPAQVTDGAPSDCVALALLGLVKDPIDMVISGLNPNANLGHDVTYSGTVTAAMEAAISGIPGIAFSLDAPESHQGPLDFLPAALAAAQIVEQVMERPFPSGLLLNVNIPYGPEEERRGIAITRQGLRVYRDALVERSDPRGRSYFWIGGEAPTGVLEPGTDFWALSEGFVSVTPLQLDLTADEHIRTLDSWDLSL